MTTATTAPTLVLPGVPGSIDTSTVVDQMVRRASSMGFASWWRRAESVGFCAHPIQLTGTDEIGRDRVVWTRCNNRRAQVCPSCSDLYARDTWQLVHAGTAGGHHKCFERAAELGCEAIQIFTRAPSRWQGPALSAKGVEQFRQARSQHGSPPVIAHDIYLANLAAADDTIRQRSLDSMLNELGRCEALGLDGLVCHMGSHPDEDQGLQRYGQAIAEILEKTNRCPILLETTAGQGTCLGHRLEHLARVIEANRAHPRLGVCLDTCHAHAGGLDLETVVDDLRAVTGRIDLVHLNDSRDEADSGADRHANLGAGHIQPDLLAHVVREAGAPALVETPGGAEEHVADFAFLRERLG